MKCGNNQSCSYKSNGKCNLRGFCNYQILEVGN